MKQRNLSGKSCESIHHIEERKNTEEKQKHYKAKIKISGIQKEILIDTGSPVTIMPFDKRIVNQTEKQKITSRYQDFSKNAVIPGKDTDEHKIRKQQTEKNLISDRTDITPLLGMDWMKRFRLTSGRIELAESNQSEKEKIINKFPDLFEDNKTINDTEINIPLEPRHYQVKQKARSIPVRLQEDIGRELERLIKAGHLEKVNNVDNDSFVSPVVITIKNDKSEKVALDSRKLNDNCIKPRPHIPNVEELLNQISVKITRDQKTQLFISKIDLDYAFGQRNKPTMCIRNYRS